MSNLRKEKRDSQWNVQREEWSCYSCLVYNFMLACEIPLCKLMLSQNRKFVENKYIIRFRIWVVLYKQTGDLIDTKYKYTKIWISLIGIHKNQNFPYKKHIVYSMFYCCAKYCVNLTTKSYLSMSGALWFYCKNKNTFFTSLQSY